MYDVDALVLLDVVEAMLIDLVLPPLATNRDQVISDLFEHMALPPYPDEESIGTTRVEREAAEAMFALAGGPAPMLDRTPDE